MIIGIPKSEIQKSVVDADPGIGSMLIPGAKAPASSWSPTSS